MKEKSFEAKKEFSKEEIKQLLIERLTNERNAKWNELTELVPESVRKEYNYQGREPAFSIQEPGWWQDFIRQTVPERLEDFKRILEEADKKHSRIIDVLYERIPIGDILKEYPDLTGKFES